MDSETRAFLEKMISEKTIVYPIDIGCHYIILEIAGEFCAVARLESKMNGQKYDKINGKLPLKIVDGQVSAWVHYTRIKIGAEDYVLVS